MVPDNHKSYWGLPGSENCDLLGHRDSSRSRRDRYSPTPFGLLVRNISLDARPEDLRIPFERFGAVKDIYLPKIELLHWGTTRLWICEVSLSLKCSRCKGTVEPYFFFHHFSFV
ncbi:uncharacterized protein LOC131302645 [Rhododendron vialii]|uniref:uncharacterized protein LOC131302645 n=1 Tax=Rhododendron vialii TaxID=182163 RepID=UPI0026600021|nr:uncharacterized protein LOC131302645 [Rhododendron vialii]